MASTKKEERASKKYYDTHKSYRKKKIKKILDDQKENPQKDAKKSKEYYHKNEEYRKYKQNYAKKYRKREPLKSKARKDRTRSSSR